jgi:hypothetical protein
VLVVKSIPLQGGCESLSLGSVRVMITSAEIAFS